MKARIEETLKRKVLDFSVNGQTELLTLFFSSIKSTINDSEVNFRNNYFKNVLLKDY